MKLGTISVSKEIGNENGNKISKKKVKSDNDDDDNKELIKLEGPVLTGNSNEATAIDPLLLAVPLPIIQIGAISNSNSNTNVNDFEHSFPSFHEIDNDQKLKKSASIHLYRTLGYSFFHYHLTLFIIIIGNLNNNDTKNRLRDPHMLMYLGKIIDENSLLALCKSIVDPKSPGNIITLYHNHY